MIDKKTKRKQLINLILVLVLTSFARAFAVHVFLLPKSITNGGASGLAIIITDFYKSKSPWMQQGIISLYINIPLLILAFFLLNKRFVLRTCIATVLTSIFTDLMSGKWWHDVAPNIVFPMFSQPDYFAATLGAGACWGIAVGYLLKINCSTGGSDIVGLLIQNKFPQMKVVWLIFAVDSVVGLINGVAKAFSINPDTGQPFGSNMGLSMALYSILAVFIASFVSDIVQRGFISTVEIKVITTNPDEISDFIIKNLKRSVTVVKATGMYTKEDKFLVFCIVRKREMLDVKNKIKAIDPSSFLYVSSVADIAAKGFDNTITPTSKIK